MVAALYARVSTGKQAERNLSIPDQLRQMREWCKRKGYRIGEEFIEPGATGTDDKRPAFQEMIQTACCKEKPFDAIIVHSLSRFFRDMIESELYQRRLRKFGVIMLSITQETADDPTGQMVRRFFSMIDEYQSQENAKHTLRAMKENARQGFHNGSKPPFGYKVTEVAGLGNKGKKKKLEIDESEAGIIKRIFNLYLDGERGHSMGLVGIASRLNSIPITRRGSLWRKNRIHEILTDPVYIGKYYFNKKRTKTGEAKPQSDWILTEVPPIIDEHTFQRAAKRLESRSPMTVPPRIVNTPNLLIGLLKCGKCGSAMTLATGKSGQYRYYKCTRKTSMGAQACDSPNLAMDNFDETILAVLGDHIFTPARVTEMLDLLEKRMQAQAARPLTTQRKLDAERREVKAQIDRLYDAIAKGIIPLDDELLKEKVQRLKARHDEILLERASVERKKEFPLKNIKSIQIEGFCKALFDKMRDRSTDFGRDYLRFLLDEIVVEGKEVVLRGRYNNLIGAISKNLDPPSGVPRFGINWLPGTDSNHQPSG